MDYTPVCTNCGEPLRPEFIVCPRCGVSLRPKSLATGIGKQIMIYGISFFLAPLGLRWAMQYLMGHTRKEKTIGIIAVVLTMASIGTTLTTVFIAMKKYSDLLNNLGSLH